VGYKLLLASSEDSEDEDEDEEDDVEDRDALKGELMLDDCKGCTPSSMNSPCHSTAVSAGDGTVVTVGANLVVRPPR